MPFKGKISIVTGGGSGIGRSLSEELAAAGAIVVVADIDGSRAERVAEGINGRGGRADAAAVDVTRADQVQWLVDDAAARYGRVDYLFNNAGIVIVAEARDMVVSDWQRLLAVNVHGVVHGVAAAYPRMVAQGFGHIVNTASMAGLIPTPAMAAYGLSKHAVVGLSTSLRLEAAGLGVKVSVACPGFVETPIFDAAEHFFVDREKLRALISVKPIAADACARGILRGVARNRAIIVVPFSARLVWWVQRLAPGLLLRLLDRSVPTLRRLRDEGVARRRSGAAGGGAP